MVRIAVLTVSLLAIAAPGVASAGCVEGVEETRARLDSLKKETAAGAPPESWFGEPGSPTDVQKLLDGAADLAKEGKEEACQEQLTQAKAVLGEIESKRTEQKAQRARETNEIRKDLKDQRKSQDTKKGSGG